jgi:hypothetical protein
MLDVLLQESLIVLEFIEKVKNKTLLSQIAVKQNAAHEVHDSNELLSVLQEIIADKEIKETMLKSQTIFKTEYLNNMDGKSNERIAEAISNAYKNFSTQLNANSNKN